MNRESQRVAWFIDGFNLYYALRKIKNGEHLWLDLGKLAENLIKPHQTITNLMYFTAAAELNTDSKERQFQYWEALKETAQFPLSIHVNSFAKNNHVCTNCDYRNRIYTEKQTDVALGVKMVQGALLDEFDVAVLVSSDTDFIPAIQGVLEASKRVVLALPPSRRSLDLEQAASGVIHISEAVLRRSQLPDVIVTSSAVHIAKPNFYNQARNKRFTKWPLTFKGSD